VTISNSTSSSLADRLAYTVRLQIPGFSKSMAGHLIEQRSLEQRDSEDWYREFRDKVYSAVGNCNMPVFRFSDGECFFTVGYRLPPTPSRRNPVAHYARMILSAYVKHRLHRHFRSGTVTTGFETYTGGEWEDARNRFADCLRRIAGSGIIALNFVRQDGEPLCDHYFPDVCAWLDRHRILVDHTNSVPFFFVYALLLGPDRQFLLRQRHVVVVTSLSPGKRSAIEETLTREQVRSVQFINLSPQKAMFDTIDTGNLVQPVELVLIGAGVGAANVLCQLQHLGTVCIDAGHVLDCYANPRNVGVRAFTRPDDPHWVVGALK